ncbi:hypothetical protein F5882DRAFT_94558 [Hyaloscypha sp. PMI_1271]|nr:hypothetical protein F5882DRAFT_94558 [Hyaloscypha sp. PMI_1271]
MANRSIVAIRSQDSPCSGSLSLNNLISSSRAPQVPVNRSRRAIQFRRGYQPQSLSPPSHTTCPPLRLSSFNPFPSLPFPWRHNPRNQRTTNNEQATTISIPFKPRRYLSTAPNKQNDLCIATSQLLELSSHSPSPATTYPHYPNFNSCMPGKDSETPFLSFPFLSSPFLSFPFLSFPRLRNLHQTLLYYSPLPQKTTGRDGSSIPAPQSQALSLHLRN